MSEPRQIAVVTAAEGYDGIHRAFRARFSSLGLTREQTDEIAGLTPGHASKILAPYPMRALGRTTWGPMLHAAGLMIVLIEDPARAGDLGANGHRNTAMPKPLSMGLGNLPERRALERTITRELMRKNGRKGGKARKRYTTRRQRKRIAKRAAKIRWRKERAAQEAITLAARPTPP